MAKTGLGKGFGSLLPDTFDQSVLLDKQDRVQKVLVTDIKPDPNQPRRTFDAEAIKELATSISQYGILQPLVITDINGQFVIVAGERRWHAAQKAGLTHVPALVRSTQELERLEIGLIENMQRVDLSPLEQAISIARLHEQFNVPHREIAKRLGKAYTTIVNTVRLLQLPEFAQKALSDGKITEGHARAVLALKEIDKQKELIHKIEQNNWSVRQAEQFVSENKERSVPEEEVSQPKRTVINTKASESLSKKWGFKVTVATKAKGGKIAMDFKSREELDKFLQFLELAK